MAAVLTSRASIYPVIKAGNKAVLYGRFNVLTAGALHALFSVHFAEGSIGEAGRGSLSAASVLVVMISGMAVAFLMHAGAAMFLWTFTRGVGGEPDYLPLYRNLGISFIGLWPVAPFLAAAQSGDESLLVRFLLVIASTYALAIAFSAVRSASGLSSARLVAAFTMTIVVAGSFLYLWL